MWGRLESRFHSLLSSGLLFEPRVGKYASTLISVTKSISSIFLKEEVEERSRQCLLHNSLHSPQRSGARFGQKATDSVVRRVRIICLLPFLVCLPFPKRPL